MKGAKGKTVIVGGGIIGLTTALELAERGADVVVVEAKDRVGEGASFANGGLLTPSMPEPWNGPGVARHLLASLFDPGAAMKLRLSAVPGLAGWGARFLWNSNEAAFRRATNANFQLCHYSRTETERLIERHGLECEQAFDGTLKVFTDKAALQGSARVADSLKSRGLAADVLSGDEVVAREPLLAPVRDRIEGGILYPGDGSADCFQFTQGVARRLAELGGDIVTSARVTGLKLAGNRVEGVETDIGTVRARRVVLTAGVATPRLLGPLGIRLPIAPAKGYSLTFSTGGNLPLPARPIIDDALHVGITPLGDRLRLVGTAEFAGHDTRLTQSRFDNLEKVFRLLLPELSERIDLASGERWCGLRPMSADGMPFIDACAPQGLWVNSGHGHLGWSMAVGSAKHLADLIEGRAPRLGRGAFAIKRPPL